MRQQYTRFKESNASCTLASQGPNSKHIAKPDLPCKAEMHFSIGITKCAWDKKHDQLDDKLLTYRTATHREQ